MSIGSFNSDGLGVVGGVGALVMRFTFLITDALFPWPSNNVSSFYLP